jgi:hypothetical protein
MTEGIDAWLLGRADHIAAWSRRHRRGDQWAFAQLCLDMGLVMILARTALAMDERGVTGLGLLSNGFLLGLFVFMRARESEAVRAHSGMSRGAMLARVGEKRLRRSNLVMLILVAGIGLLHPEPSDAAFLLAFMSYDMALYFKAADDGEAEA